MEITGHKDIRMLIERYTHPTRENKSLAVKSLDINYSDITFISSKQQGKSNLGN